MSSGLYSGNPGLNLGAGLYGSTPGLWGGGAGLDARFGVPDPRALFAAGQVGVLFDPSVLSSVWQDSARTTPGAVDQPVGSLDDLSGNGLHAAASGTARPTLRIDATGRYYIEFDGVNNRMATANVNMSAGTVAFATVGARKVSDAAFQAIMELTANPNTTAGAWALGCGTTAGDASRRTWAAAAYGTALLLGGAAIYAQPDTKVLTGLFDTAGSTQATELGMRLNGAEITPTYSGASAGTGNLANLPIYLGQRGVGGNGFTNGRLYCAATRAGAYTAADLAIAEAWANARTGAF